MKLLFMTNLYPKETEQEVRSKMKFNMYDAANVLQWNLVSGILACGCDDMILFNHLPIDSFPTYYPDWRINGFTFDHGGENKSQNIPFLNVRYLKRLFLNIPFVRRTKKWTDENPDGVILAYSLSTVFLTAIARSKKKHPNIKAFAIVADLPQFTSPTGNFLQRFFCKYNAKKVQKLLNHVDGFVLLTEQMADKLAISQPFIVMEGIAPCNPIISKVKEETNKQKIILYTGSMNTQYGILTLLDAFQKIDSQDYTLLLCGLGNAESIIKERMQSDPRISFRGKVPHEEVLRLQQMATVVINPRQNNEEFTKYSFPSKTMEYLASGTPLIAYKLDGIPDEYDKHIIYVPDNSPETLAHVIMDICEMPENQRKEKAKKAKEFVLKEKNHVAQAKRILDFINK